MLTWASFIGELFKFIINKLIGSKIDLSLDQKRKASKAFLDLFDSISRIESIDYAFLSKIEPIVKGEKDRIFSSWLWEISKEIDAASNDFLSSIRKIGDVIGIYDPSLSVMLGKIISFKGLVLESSAAFDKMKFDIKWEYLYRDSRRDFKSIEYSMPTDDLMGINFEEYYGRIKENVSLAWGDYGKLEMEWPEDVLLSLLEGKLIKGHIGPEDLDQVKWLYGKFYAYLPMLSEARESLRTFIKTNFTLDDLLYVKGISK